MEADFVARSHCSIEVIKTADIKVLVPVSPCDFLIMVIMACIDLLLRQYWKNLNTFL